MKRKTLLIATTCLLLLLLTGYAALIRTAARTASSERYIFSYAPNAAVMIQLGPQPICPPLVRCPTMTVIPPHGVAIWLITGPTDWQTVPLWRGIPGVNQRRILYLPAD